MDGIKTVVILFIVAIMIGALMHTSVDVYTTNTTTWANFSGTAGVYNTLPLLGIVAVLVGIAAIVYRQFEGQ